jgi:hypothetical protein
MRSIEFEMNDFMKFIKRYMDLYLNYSILP